MKHKKDLRLNVLVESCKIRNVEKSDLNQLLVLIKEHAEFENNPLTIDGQEDKLKKALFNDPPVLNCLIVEIENDIIGYATFIDQFSTWDARFYTYLDCLYIKSNFRNLGLGKLLMEKIREISRLNGNFQIQWQTPDFNESAIGFYQYLGASYKRKYRFFWNKE